MVLPDSITTYLLCAADAAVVLPGVFICLFPARKWFVLSTKTVFILAFAVASGFSLVVPFLGYGTTVNGNLFILPFLVIALIACLILVRLPLLKLLYLFLCTTASLSFGGLVNYLVIDYLHPDTASSLHWEGTLTQWILSGLLLGFFLWFNPRRTLLLETLVKPYVWLLICLMPATITVLNILMIPQNPEIIRQGRMFQMSLLIEGLLLVFFLFYQLMICEIAQSLSEHYEKEKLSQLLEEEVLQYQSLQNYMKQTDLLMHDMRQVMRTIRQLAAEQNLDDLDRLVREYETTSLAVPTPNLFCSHVPLNAMLSYYAGLAKQQNVTTRWQIDVPSELPIPDVEICTLFGNLLENALNACQNVPEGQRYIELSADTNTPGALFLVMINSAPAESNTTPSPRKFHREGIGLGSIQSTAEKYGGTAEFSAKEHEFRSYIMLHI